MSLPAPHERFERRAAALVVCLALALGAFLSLRGLGRVHLFGDEFHSVRNLGLGYGELLRSYDRFGSGLLLPLAQKLCVDLLGPGLLAYRLPAVAGALGTLLLLYPTARLCMRPTPAAIATLALATNPIHVFYSRYGRAYSIATFLALAFVYALLRVVESERPRRRHQLAVALSGGLLPFAHLYAATLGGPVALVALVLHARRPGRRWQALAWPLLAAAGIALALHLPALESLTSFTDDKAFAGSAGPFDALHVGMLLYGCRGSALMAFVGVGLALILFGRRSPGRAALLAAAALSPGLLLLLARPAGMPFAYARYMLPSLPFQVMLLAWLFDSAIGCLPWASRAPRGRTTLSLGVAATLIAVLFASGPLGERRAPGGPFANSNLSLCPLPTFDLPWPNASGFYDLVAKSEQELTIIEAPELWNRTALLYRNHWLQHGKDVLSGYVFEKDPRKIPHGFTVDLNAPGALSDSGAQYLVLHVNLYRELANYWFFVDQTWKREGTPELEPLMAAHLSYGMAHERLDQVLALAERLETELGPPDYADTQVRVWALR